MHEQLHVPRDIERNGSPRETYGGPLEHNYLELKKHSKRTQRNCKTYDKQISQHVAKSYIINYCFDRMQRIQNNQDYIKTKLQTLILQQSSKGILILSKGQNGKIDHSFEWTTKTLVGRENTIKFNKLALECLAYQFKDKITS